MSRRFFYNVKIIALVVTKNEYSRYFYSFLRNLKRIVDEVYIYDDQSTDQTVRLAKRFDVNIRVRPDDVPSFMEHEGRFREAAWDWVWTEIRKKVTEEKAQAIRPLVLAIDADEFVVREDNTFIRAGLECLSHQLYNERWLVADFQVLEGWALDTKTNTVLYRTDGEWGNIFQRRLVWYRDDADISFPDKKMASGSLPMFYMNMPSLLSPTVKLLHVGYADSGDRKAKYDRYSNLEGHSTDHIESIMKEPTLSTWTLQVPKIWPGPGPLPM